MASMAFLFSNNDKHSHIYYRNFNRDEDTYSNCYSHQHSPNDIHFNYHTYCTDFNLYFHSRSMVDLR